MSLHVDSADPAAIAVHSVDELSALYRGLYHTNLTVARALAGHAPAIVPLGDKWLVMRAIFVFLEHCQTLSIRLAELRCPPKLIGAATATVRDAGDAVAGAADWTDAARFLRELLDALHAHYQACHDGAGAVATAHDRAMFAQLAADIAQLRTVAADTPATESGQPVGVDVGALLRVAVPAGPPPTPAGAFALAVPACPRRAYPEWATFVRPRPPKPAGDAIEAGLPPVDTPAQVAAFLRHGLQIEFVAMDVPLRNIAEFDDLPLEFYRDMARHAHDEMRHTVMLFEEFDRLGVDYKQIPFEDPDFYQAIVSGDLPYRLIITSRTGEAEAIETFNYIVPKLRAAGFHTVATMFDHALSDEVRHVAYANKWLRFLVGDDDAAVEAATKDAIDRFNDCALDIGLGERAVRDVNYLDSERSTAVDGPLREMAGFSEREIRALIESAAGRPAPR